MMANARGDGTLNVSNPFRAGGEALWKATYMETFPWFRFKPLQSGR